jgi:hypothetical protein
MWQGNAEAEARGTKAFPGKQAIEELLRAWALGEGRGDLLACMLERAFATGGAYVHREQFPAHTA